MGEELFAYSVARIRSKELLLFDSHTIEQIITCGSYSDVLRLLIEKGWGYKNSEKAMSAEDILTAEREKTWEFIKELIPDISFFDVFILENEFHNLKAAIKAVCSDREKITDFKRIFLSGGKTEPETMIKAVKENDFSILPEDERAMAKKAYQTLLQTRDGQLCDMIIDKAALDKIINSAKNQNNKLISEYAELYVAKADIKIAFRCVKTGKSFDFIKQSLAQCETLDVDKLAKSAAISEQEICGYLISTNYNKASEAYNISPSKFEQWCDNLIIEYIKPQKYNPFTIAPIIAYYLARENEIKCVRIILAAKQNNLTDDFIRERMREMYV